ncbi:uncharacterized protein LOC142541616 isoform X1 [Primulina tabacum]|uniref:uncharacterized protein LOC142541616 isoform X1 n=1 Tax=Primulina tabacum TaxID=48773 RepID=UPI003F5A83D6
MKGEKMDRRSSFGNMVRNKFSNITNSLPQPKPPVISEKSPLDSASAKEYIDHLVKEKMVLAKIVQEKMYFHFFFILSPRGRVCVTQTFFIFVNLILVNSKVLELSGIEIQKLRTSLLMMRLHNWNLAQSNSQMLTALSLGREKLKAQQHDLVCKEALLKAKDLELKESEMVRRENEFRKDRKSYNANRSKSSKTQSFGSSPLSQPHADKQAVGSNRRCSRRRSASSGIQHQEPADILYDIDYNTTFPFPMLSNSSNHERYQVHLSGKPFNSRSSLKFNLTRKDS